MTNILIRKKFNDAIKKLRIKRLKKNKKEIKNYKKLKD